MMTFNFSPLIFYQFGDLLVISFICGVHFPPLFCILYFANEMSCYRWKASKWYGLNLFPCVPPNEGCFCQFCVVSACFLSLFLRKFVFVFAFYIFFWGWLGWENRSKCNGSVTISISRFELFDLVWLSLTTFILYSSGVSTCQLGLSRNSKAGNYLGSWLQSITCFFEPCKCVWLSFFIFIDV